MKIFVFEHVSGGGMVDQDLASDLTAQGTAMLTAIVSDMVDAGVAVSATRDGRIELDVAGARIIDVDSSGRLGDVFAEEARSADAALVIAPETDGALDTWCTVLRDVQVRSLGCMPDAVSRCANKLELSRWLRLAGVPTPTTWPAADGKAVPCHGDASVCIVEKPWDGAGCERTAILDVRGDHAATVPRGESVMVQQVFVPGLPVSVSFVVHGAAVRALPAGRQVIERRGNVLTYRGGGLPLDPALSERATALARRAIDAVPGLHGFVGVDLILADEPAGDRVIEINPRLTVSYVGLRALCRTNLASAIIDPDAPLHWTDRVVRFDATGRVSM